MARIVREEIHTELRVARDELRRELTRPPHPRTARLYTGAGVTALYAGGAAVALLVLLLAMAVPAWAAALIMTALLVIAAVALREAAKRPSPAPHAGQPAPPAMDPDPRGREGG
ncbi:hypothetical protein G5C51_33965 [Streptomyces sp. A7024]|uniref:Phage holin family protein n=2 Tax=Streptomyces coryli TaxID=1128680 RepID=A0A6G4UC26_9ACTN|nr:phage holin family protein [Streptomyces coryli]NGN68887.1 hypothetical protein [Streptomyces coryli]